MKNAIVCFIGLVFVVSVSAEPLLEGRVRLESGEPVAHAQVRLFDMSDLRQGAIARAQTDGTGYFALPLAALRGSALPEGFALGPNYPNPFNPSTIIPYQLAASSEVRLEVFNLLGQRIATLVDGVRPAGFHTATWHATDAAGRAVGAGVYIYRMTVGVESQTGRMVLIDGQAGVSAAGAASVWSGVFGGGRSDGTGEQAYGLIVSGEGLVPYVDSSFRVEAGMTPVELVVSAGPHQAGKVPDLFDALNDAGEEEETRPSGKAQATLEAPPAPTNLRFEAVTDSSCTVRWDAAEGATDYDVNYKRAVGGTWTNEPHKGTRLYTTIYDLEPNTEYRWAARAENSDGPSDWVFGPNFTTLPDHQDGQDSDEEMEEEDETTEEEEETDSTSSEGGPDLVVDSPLVTGSSAFTPGGAFTLLVTVRNQGDSLATATALRYYRSTDATISTRDTEVGTGAVDALAAAGTSTKLIHLTAPLSEGIYYYGACVTSVAGESNTNNNCSSSRAVRVWSKSSPVTIPDANLRAAIAAELGKASDATITKGEMTTLTNLEARDVGISDLTGLEFATKLRELSLGGNEITDISALADLTNLTRLYLHVNQIRSISALSGLTNLTVLSLQINQIRSISALSGLTNLWWLSLGGNEIRSISALSGLTNLWWLSLGGNEITDISALSGLTKLTYLWLDDNNLTDSDLSSLSGLTNLRELSLGDNQITGVSALSGLTNLESLDLRLNLLSVSSNAHIAALERRGVTVTFDLPFRESDFDIELVFLHDHFTEKQKRIFRYAARRWMSIIREDLPDYTLTQGWSGNCGQPYEIPSGERIDDLRIYVGSVERMEGRIHVANEEVVYESRAQAGPELLREIFLPVLGCVTVNSKFFDSLPSISLLDISLHEMGHVLGVGTTGFRESGFLRDSSDGPYFNGPRAIAAFDDAGGRNYTGAKVPVEKSGGHWKSPVLEGELMSSTRGRSALSAITIQALADLGYVVDVTQADPYTLPRTAAKASAKIAAPSTHAHGEQREPMYVVDPQGRIVRTISP